MSDQEGSSRPLPSDPALNLLNNYKVMNDNCHQGLEDFDDAEDMKEIIF
jgi:hypothetical protein